MARGLSGGRAAALMLAAAAAVAMIAPPAAAQSVRDFYSGRQIKFYVGSGGGLGYDLYSRVLARHMSRHLPGNPHFVVQQMPGAAGIIAANYLYNLAPKDGSEMGMVGRGVGTRPLLDPKDAGPRYVATRFNWIGTPQQEVGLVIVRASSPVRTMQDLLVHDLVVSSSAPAAPTSYYPRLFNKLIGTRFKVIEGYASSPAALLAVERGEVDGHSSGSSSGPNREQFNRWLAEGKARIVAQIGLARDPEYKDVPLLLDLLKRPADRQVVELVLTQQVMAWPVVAPPDVPADRVKALRAAFDAAVKDPEFLADAAREKLIVNPVGGEQIQRLLEQVYATPREMLEVLAGL